MASLDKIIDGVLSREGGASGTLVVANHLTQMKLFGIRQGVEFYPMQDDPMKTRRNFIQQLHEDNKIDLHLDRWWDLMLCKGQILFYLRPTGTSYRIYCYDKDQFKDYYDANGDLKKVTIIYDYEVEESWWSISKVRWVKLEITKQKITRYESETKPEFGISTTGYNPVTPVETVENTLGFIPCVVVNNYVTAPGKRGKNEFDWLKSQIEGHDKLVTSIQDNIEFFGNPTLVSTRSREELLEATEGTRPQRSTLSSNGGWYGSTQSTRKSDPFNRALPGEGLRIMRVVGRVQADERFGYISPDPITPDHTQYALQAREDIHTALGGVDPRGISSGATAFEIKSLFGQAAATAKKKADHIYTYGLCKIFELAIAAEELLFKTSIAEAMNQVTPPKVDEETGQSNAITPQMISDGMAMNLLIDGVLPDGKKPPKDFQPVGLPPLGNRKIMWRWKGPVFEDSPQDILQKSIVVRNLEEVGVETIEALKFLFASKTEQEILSMLTGYPFREMQASASALSQQLSILGQLLNTPNPLDPTIPLGAVLNNLSIIQATLDHATKRLNYGQQPSPADQPYAFTPAPGGAATNAATISDSTAAGVLPAVPGFGSNATSAGATPTPGNPVPPTAAAGIPIPGQPLNPNGSVSQYAAGSGATADWANPLPVPGSTVTDAAQRSGSQSLPEYYSNIPTLPGIPTDLLDRPALIAQLFPALFGATQPVEQPQRDRQRSNSRRSNPRK